MLQLMLSNCGLSQPGIPNNAGPFPGTTQKLIASALDALVDYSDFAYTICSMCKLL